MSEINQTHTGTGDNVGRDKIVTHYYGEKKIPKGLTPFPIPSGIFVGRDDKLSELHEIFFESDGNKARVIRGIGGVGKTTFARHYSHKYHNEYRHIAWIDYLGNLRDSFITNSDIRNTLKIVKEIEGKNAEEIFSLIASELRTLGDEGLCLLIVDNVENYDEAYFKKINMSGWHLLLTSREKLSENISDFNLDVLNDANAFKMFREICPDTGRISDDQVKTLLNGVGNHTLMIEILAKHAKKISTSFEKLNKCIPENLKTKITLSRDNKTIEGSETITSFLKSIFKITNLNDIEKKLLMNFTAMPSIPIEYEKLEMLLRGVDDDLQLNLIELEEKGWLQKEGESYKMHQLIQQVLRAEFSLEGKDLEKMIKNINGLLNIDESKDNPVDIFQWAPFGDSILEFIKKQHSSQISILQNNLALVYRDIGDYENARDLLQKALQSDLKNFGEGHPSVAICQSNLALVYEDLGDYENARDLLLKALQSDLKNFGEGHPSVAICQSNLALVYEDLGDYENARDLLLKALQSDLKNFGEGHPRVAKCQSNLALVYEDLGDYENARDLLLKALQSDLKNFGEGHPTVAKSQSNLASIYRDLGDYENARDLLLKALQSYVKNFGEGHPTVATSQSNLATVYQTLGNYENARDLLLKALQSIIKNFGEGHPNISIGYSNLASVYRDLGDYENARDLLLKALESNLKNFGEGHPSVARSQSDLAIVYGKLGDYEQARELLLKALQSDLRNFEEEHPNVASSQSNLATVYQDLGDYENALDLLLKALQSSLKNFGEGHPNVARCQSNLASVYVSLNRISEAMELWESAYKICLNSFGENHPNTKIVKEWMDLYKDR